MFKLFSMVFLLLVAVGISQADDLNLDVWAAETASFNVAIKGGGEVLYGLVVLARDPYVASPGFFVGTGCGVRISVGAYRMSVDVSRYADRVRIRLLTAVATGRVNLLLGPRLTFKDNNIVARFVAGVEF